MTLQELRADQDITIQITKNDQVVEFKTKVAKINADRILVNPYLYNGVPLKFEIDAKSSTICCVFAIDKETEKRMIWNNVNLTTVNINGDVYYSVSTYTFNSMAMASERRDHVRTQISLKGKVVQSGLETEVLVHDVSNRGIGFFAPLTFAAISKDLTICFKEVLGNDAFDIVQDCVVVYSTQKMGMLYFGCEVVKPTRDFLVYGRAKRNGGVVVKTQRELAMEKAAAEQKSQ